ncbi:jg27650, partial [Pararge aegeria aegeria]
MQEHESLQSECPAVRSFHSRYRNVANSNVTMTNGNYTYLPAIQSIPLPQLPQPIPLPQMYQRFPMPPPQTHPHLDNFNVP